MAENRSEVDPRSGGWRYVSDGAAQNRTTDDERSGGWNYEKDGASQNRRVDDPRGAGAPPVRATDLPDEILREGDRKPGVRALQQWLNFHGFGAGAEDGVFGQSTRDALRAYQMAAGLTADGVYGPETMRAMARGAPESTDEGRTYTPPASSPPASGDNPGGGGGGHDHGGGDGEKGSQAVNLPGGFEVWEVT